MVTTPDGPPTDESSGLRARGYRDWVGEWLARAGRWIGQLALVAGFPIVIAKYYLEFSQYLGLPPLLVIVLFALVPLFALASFVPEIVERHRIKRYSEVGGEMRTGYFTLRPREDEDSFGRADNAHNDILSWIQDTKESVLYLTGNSGTGKSSVLHAWVIPKLRRAMHVVIDVRGYGNDLTSLIAKKILEPGVIWDKPPSNPLGIEQLLARAAQRLNGRRLIIIVDQFEEFLLLKDRKQQSAFQKLVSSPIQSTIFLLTYRLDYEVLIHDGTWPKLQLDTNRKVIYSFTENAAATFLRKSGLELSKDLVRAALREAAELDATKGFVRPVTLNLCGLVLSRFSNSLPREFRGGLIRGFLRESLSLPEVRGAVGKVIPLLITDNVTKRARTIGELTHETGLPEAVLRACLRRLGESDRGIVRPLDMQQDTWEISHDFLVPMLDALLAKRMTSWWRSVRPWLAWVAVGLMAVFVITVEVGRPDPSAALRKLGWTVKETDGVLHFSGGDLDVNSQAIFRRLAHPFGLSLRLKNVRDVSPMREFGSMVSLDIGNNPVTDVSPLRNLSLKYLYLGITGVTDVSMLKDFKSLGYLSLIGTKVEDISVLGSLQNLTELDIRDTKVSDISSLGQANRLSILHLRGSKVKDISSVARLTSLTVLDLSSTAVTDLSPLMDSRHLAILSLLDTRVSSLAPVKGLRNLRDLYLARTLISDISPLREMHRLNYLNLQGTQVKDISILKDLRQLTNLDMAGLEVSDISALAGLRALTFLNLSGTIVADISPLRDLRSLTMLSLEGTRVKDLSSLANLGSLTHLYLSNTQVSDVSALRGLSRLVSLRIKGTTLADVTPLRYLRNLTQLNISKTKVSDVSALNELALLESLDVSATNVKDVSALAHLKRLTITGP